MYEGGSVGGYSGGNVDGGSGGSVNAAAIESTPFANNGHGAAVAANGEWCVRYRTDSYVYFYISFDLAFNSTTIIRCMHYYYY